jgi:hypothetical protein
VLVTSLDLSLISAGSGLLGVVVGAVVAYVKERRLANRLEEGDRQYLAARVSGLLDDFVDQCLAIVGDQGMLTHTDHGEPEREPTVVAPSFDPLALSLDWRVIEVVLLDRLLALPREIERANSELRLIAEYEAAPPDYEEWYSGRRKRFARLGREAYKLSDEFRVHVGLRTSTARRQLDAELAAFAAL